MCERLSEDSTATASSSSPETDKGSPTAVDADSSEFECPICCDLLLDPIVGKCGHDFCKHCLEEWIASQPGPATCPLCRTVLSQDGGRLGVCIRLKNWIEKLFPDKVRLRRQEVGWPVGIGASATRYCHAYQAPSGPPDAQRSIVPIHIDWYPSLDCLQCMMTILYP